MKKKYITELYNLGLTWGHPKDDKTTTKQLREQINAVFQKEMNENLRLEEEKKNARS